MSYASHAKQATPASKPAAGAAHPPPPAAAGVHPSTVQKTTVVEVNPHNVSSIFNAIWSADKNKIHPFHEDKFKPSEFHGNYVVKICDAPKSARGESLKNHNLFVIYKWNSAKKIYEKTHNTEILKDPAMKSYKLVYDLFDNYESDETKPEVNTAAECKEINEFLGYVADSDPCKVAASYLRAKYANSTNLDREDKESFSSREKFISKLKKIWFDQYDWGKMLSLSGFEHTFVGERRADGTVMGYHFWYKYYVDDSVENATGQDAIDFNRRLDDASSDDYIAIRFAQLVDTDGDGVIDGSSDAHLFKSFGSFFVGCSAECKMALGTVAYYESKAAWAERRKNRTGSDTGHDEEGTAVSINGHNYKLSMHRGGDRNQHCRSFFPEKI